MTGKDAGDGFDADALIDAMLPYLGLSIVPGYRPGIVQHLMAARRIAAPLMALPLEDEAEPAPVYRP